MIINNSPMSNIAQQNCSSESSGYITSLKGSIPSNSASDKSQISPPEQSSSSSNPVNNAPDGATAASSYPDADNNFFYLRRPLRGGSGELERIIAIEEKDQESS